MIAISSISRSSISRTTAGIDGERRTARGAPAALARDDLEHLRLVRDRAARGSAGSRPWCGSTPRAPPARLRSKVRRGCFGFGTMRSIAMSDATRLRLSSRGRSSRLRRRRRIVDDVARAGVIAKQRRKATPKLRLFDLLVHAAVLSRSRCIEFLRKHDVSFTAGTFMVVENCGQAERRRFDEAQILRDDRLVDLLRRRSSALRPRPGRRGCCACRTWSARRPGFRDRD